MKWEYHAFMHSTWRRIPVYYNEPNYNEQQQQVLCRFNDNCFNLCHQCRGKEVEQEDEDGYWHEITKRSTTATTKYWIWGFLRSVEGYTGVSLYFQNSTCTSKNKQTKTKMICLKRVTLMLVLLSGVLSLLTYTVLMKNTRKQGWLVGDTLEEKSQRQRATKTETNISFKP